ncbi:MAG: nitroreductase [Spongiibacteraceae bacterium]
MKVSDAILSRCSVRSYLDKPVDITLLGELLAKAARAPSGGNIQPWNIHVVSGGKLTRLKSIMDQRIIASPRGEKVEYEIYPKGMSSQYRIRTQEIGEALYTQLGISRDDKLERSKWFAKNFHFFDAPVGLFCYIDRSLGLPQWSDLGMYLQTLMLLLREEGMDSCAQECWALYPQTIDNFLEVPSSQMLFCGMSIGWRDPEALANRVVSPRVSVDDFVHFHLDN